MFHLADVDAIVVLVRSQPLDPHDGLFKVNRNHQPVVVAFDVERDALGADDVGRSVRSLHTGGILPTCASYLVKPSVERGLHSPLVPVTVKGLHERSQGPTGDDAHCWGS